MTDPKMPPNVRVKPLDEADRASITEAAYTAMKRNRRGVSGQAFSEWDGIESWIIAETESRILSALEVVEDDDGRYVPRHVPSGMPTDCCEFGVIDMNKGGIEVCRCWTAEDATLISAALTKGSTDDRT